MKSPTTRLVTGFVLTLLVIGAYAAYTLRIVSSMRATQTQTIDKNRLAALQLLRIQTELNSLALALRDLSDPASTYPLTAWRAPLARMRFNLDDAIRREATLATTRPASQTQYLQSSAADFWRQVDTLLSIADAGQTARARELARTTLEPRQEALSALAARLLISNNEQDSQLAAQLQSRYDEIERNAWLFLGIAILLIAANSILLIRANRKLFDHVSALSTQRSELARQLISTQESTFRAISRDLHDEFGQILTALGAMLRRARTHAPDTSFTTQTQEATTIVQDTLDKIRTLSQSLQPVILEEQGLLPTISWHLAQFEKHTGITVTYTPPTTDSLPLDPARAIHVFRILQESLNNVARHSQATTVTILLTLTATTLTLTIEDPGRGITPTSRPGIGLAAMRERALILGATLDIVPVPTGGTRVTLREVPLG